MPLVGNRASQNMVVSVNYCCVTNHPKLNGVNSCFIVLKISMGKGFGQGILGVAHLCSLMLRNQRTGRGLEQLGLAPPTW